MLTGSTGFVGMNVARKLAEKHNVFCIVRDKKKFNRVLGGDMIPIVVNHPEKQESGFYSKIIEENNIDSVIHIGAITGEKNYSWEQYLATNVSWTKNLAVGFLNASVDHKKFIFMSTVGVYGTIPKKLPADEKTVYNPDGKYHNSKVMSEKELIKLDERFSFPLIILRPTIMYGFMDYGFLYKISNLIRRRKFLMCKNTIIHLLDVEKVSEVCSLILESNITGIFNICDDKPIHMRDLIKYVAELNNGGYHNVPKQLFDLLKIIPRESFRIKLKLISSSWYYSNSKIKSALNIEFGNTMDNLKKYEKWYGG